ncbi:MAG: hypothetical protein Q9214_005838, partial [Letrouitia sp. 1 TL-2023]
VVGLQHNTADDADAGRGAQVNFDFAEEEVESGLDSRGIAFGVDGELGAVIAIVDCASGGVPDVVVRGGGGEVEEVRESKGGVRRAISALRGVTRRPGLSKGERGVEEGDGREKQFKWHHDVATEFGWSEVLNNKIELSRSGQCA